MTLYKFRPTIMALCVFSISAFSAVADVPIGWSVAGSSPQDYEFSQDSNTASSGHSSALIAARAGVALRGFGTLMQTIDAENYRNGRWRLSGYLKTSDATRAQMWMRVDGPDRRVESFDNMDARPVKDTTDWIRYEIVLDVPADSVDIAFGFLLTQGGKVWGDDFRLEKVAADVPVTSPTTSATVLPRHPVNIDFENAPNTALAAEKSFTAGKINLSDMFRSNGRHGTEHPRKSSDTYNLCGMHLVAQSQNHDRNTFEWDVMLSVYSRLRSNMPGVCSLWRPLRNQGSIILWQSSSELLQSCSRQRGDLDTLRVVTKHQGRKVPTVGGLLLFGREREQRFPDAWIQAPARRADPPGVHIDDVRFVVMRRTPPAWSYAQECLQLD